MKPKKDTLEAALEYARRRLPKWWRIHAVVNPYLPGLRMTLEKQYGADCWHVITATPLTPTAIRRAVRLARKEAGI